MTMMYLMKSWASIFLMGKVMANTTLDSMVP